MMKTTAWRLMILSLCVVAFAGVSLAEPMTYSGRYDIGSWKADAEKRIDFKQQDAVILLEGRKVTLLPDGRQRVMVHRVVWIATDHAIETYADLRVPWDSARETLSVEALRVWRDNRWIDHRPTAIVETLPYAVAHAPEYAHLRETMLLHDGVELPCILEAAYVIEEKQPGSRGIEGVWVFPQDEPVLHSWLILEVPEATALHLTLSEGLGEADVSREDGMVRYSMDHGPYAAAPTPATADPAAYLPHASWSTWADWEKYGAHLRKIFDTAAGSEGKVIADSLKSLLKGSSSPAESATRIAGFIKSHTSFVRYNDDFFWAAPRTPEQSYQSGYASGLDRAILFAGLCKLAGIEVWAVYTAEGFGPVDEGIATNDRLGKLGVWASGEGLEGLYDPASSTFANGLAPILGKAIWLPGAEDQPSIRWNGVGEESRFSIEVELSYDSEKQCFTGTGVYSATGGLSPYHRMEGVAGDAKKVLSKAIAGALPGAELASWNPVSFDRFGVTAGFTLKLAAGEKDESGRIRFEVGTPSDGLLDILPDDVQVSHARRATPVILPGYLTQEVKISLKSDGLETVYLPEAVTVENGAGSFHLSCGEKEGTLSFERRIALRTVHHPAEKWEEVRTLLLQETSPRNRTLLFK